MRGTARDKPMAGIARELARGNESTPTLTSTGTIYKAHERRSDRLSTCAIEGYNIAHEDE